MVTVRCSTIKTVVGMENASFPIIIMQLYALSDEQEQQQDFPIPLNVEAPKTFLESAVMP